MTEPVARGRTRGVSRKPPGVSPPERDPWDWDYLTNTLAPKLIRVGVLRYRLSHEDAEDLVQGLFERILIKRPTARNAEAFIRTSFYHGCIDLLRHRRRTAGFDETADLSDDPIPRLVAAIAVQAALRRISVPCRQLIETYCLEEHTLTETAERLGGTVNAVWKRIDRCLSKLLQCLA